MDNNEIMGRIHNALEPAPVRDWFIAAEPAIRDSVVTMAKVDGIEAAIKGVKELYIAWLQQPRKS